MRRTAAIVCVTLVLVATVQSVAKPVFPTDALEALALVDTQAMLIAIVSPVLTLVLVAIRSAHAVIIRQVALVALTRVTKTLVEAVGIDGTGFCCARVCIATCVPIARESIVTSALVPATQVSASGMLITLMLTLTLVLITRGNTAARLLDKPIIALTRVPGTLVFAAGIKRTDERVHRTLIRVATRRKPVAREPLATDALVSDGQINAISIGCANSFATSALVGIAYFAAFAMLKLESVDALALVAKTLVDTLRIGGACGDTVFTLVHIATCLTVAGKTRAALTRVAIRQIDAIGVESAHSVAIGTLIGISCFLTLTMLLDKTSVAFASVTETFVNAV